MTRPFLGWTFTPLALGHREVLEPILSAHPQSISGYTFAMLHAWSPTFRYAWRVAEDGTLLVSCATSPGGPRHLLQPVGPFTSALEDDLLARVAREDYPVRFHGVTREFLDARPWLASRLGTEETRKYANYIYLASDLADLPGRKFHKKRNLIVQATSLTPWTSAELTPANLSGCREVLDALPPPDPSDPSAADERVAVETALRDFSALGLRGVLVTAQGRPAAFSVWEPISGDTAAVHFEKAVALKGMYQVVNQETARAIHGAGFHFINREEDLGDPGLRHAKESYHPVELRPHLILSTRAAHGDAPADQPPDNVEDAPWDHLRHACPAA
jgi:hypothetical protein